MKSFGSIAIFSDLTGVTLTVDSSNAKQVEFSDGLLFDLMKLTCFHTYITSVPKSMKTIQKQSLKKIIKFLNIA